MVEARLSGVAATTVACTVVPVASPVAAGSAPDPIDGDHLEVRLSGELDAFAAPTAARQLERLVDERRPRTVTLDVGALDFLDSGGARALLDVAQRVRVDGGTCVVRGARPVQRRVLDVVASGSPDVADGVLTFASR